MSRPKAQREMLRTCSSFAASRSAPRADYHAGKIHGVVHPYIGQEAVAVGVCAA